MRKSGIPLNVRVRMRRLANLEESRKQDRENARLWRSKNRERWNAYQRKLKRDNPERYKAYKDAYLSKNPARIIELRKQSNIRRRDKIKAASIEYYRKNRDKIIQQKTEYCRNRIARDPAYKCKKMLQNRIVECLKRVSTVKSKRTLELIGCSKEFLVQWIESKFLDGMSWGNHGYKGWHIDHVRPCASFDLADPEQQKLCFHYSNLQPLWAKENQIKSDKCQYPNT